MGDTTRDLSLSLAQQVLSSSVPSSNLQSGLLIRILGREYVQIVQGLESQILAFVVQMSKLNFHQ